MGNDIRRDFRCSRHCPKPLSFSGRDAISLPLWNRLLKYKRLACSTPIQTGSSRDGI